MLKYNWPGIIWAFIILVLSTITPPSVYIPNLFDLFAPDKIAHFLIYGAFVVILYFGFRKSGGRLARNQYSFSSLIAVTYGGLIEIYQGYLLPNRTGDYVDFIANCIGCLIGWILTKFLVKK
jgi:VanZ family protein